MMATRLAPRLAAFLVALCVPLLCSGQTSTVPLTVPVSPQSSPSASPEISRDSATRLEGRLFFSPQERQRIDETRKRGVVLGTHGTFVEMPPSVLNGFVKRNDGQITVWVDGQSRNQEPSLKVRDLQPQDVGGSSDAVRVLDSYPASNASASANKPKTVKKQIPGNVAAKRAVKK